MSTPSPDKLVVFLGGHDLEMVTLAALVRDTLGSDHVVDAGLAWGASATVYAGSIAATLHRRQVPVLVELDVRELDPLPPSVLVVDHHGDRAGADQPTALEQVFALLRLPPERWTRHLALVAANDRGYIPEMAGLGASVAEMAAIRAADRAAQGITAAEEAAAATALDRALVGRRLDETAPLVVDLPHGRTACIMDRLSLPPPHGVATTPLWPMGAGMVPVVILSPGATNVFGPGYAIAALDAAFPGGWRGGALPRSGFWGIARRLDAAAVEAVLAAASARLDDTSGLPRGTG